MSEENSTITDNKKIIDIEYEEETSDYIRGKPIYYSTSQVAEKLNEPDHTIRYWCIEFKDILKIKRKGNQRRFTDENISKLKQIQYKLRKERFTIDQVKEFCLKQELNLENKTNINEQKILKEISQQISKEISLQINEVVKLIQANQEATSKQIISEVEKKISSLQDNIDLKIDNVNVTLEKQSFNLEEDIKLVQELKEKLEENRMLYKKEQQEKEKEKQQKGFWKRIFSK